MSLVQEFVMSKVHIDFLAALTNQCEIATCDRTIMWGTSERDYLDTFDGKETIGPTKKLKQYCAK